MAIPPEDAPPVVQTFAAILAERVQDESLSVIAIKAMLRLLETSTATTMMGLQEEMLTAQRALQDYASSLSTASFLGRGSVLPLQSGCDLFVRHVSRTFVDFPGNFEDCKAMLLERGDTFAKLSGQSRSTIAELGHPFIRDDATVLTHGPSRVVSAVLLAAAQHGKQFSVVMTECSGSTLPAPPADAHDSSSTSSSSSSSSPIDASGVGEQAALLRAAGIPVTLIPDAAVASIMEEVDMAIVGAEAVVESGGVVNRTGTFQVGIICAATETPLYVAAESVKFARLYPLNQQDLPPAVLKNCAGTEAAWAPLVAQSNVDVRAPQCDYTPAKYLTLLFTDLGVLTPAAVSDELIKLYQ